VYAYLAFDGKLVVELEVLYMIYMKIWFENRNFGLV